MARWGMAVDLDRCTGCQACVIACKMENNIPPAGPTESEKGRAILWIEILPMIEGESPDLRVTFLPRPCLQCDRPPCADVCPVWATYRNPEGTVAQIYGRCIGCRYCTNACPYTVKSFNWYRPRWEPPLEACLNPDVSVRPKGVVEKCTFCHHRLQAARERARGEGRDLTPEDYVPACVAACPAHAMTFGDLDDPGSPVAEAARSQRAFHLLEELGTETKVFYLRGGA